MVSDLRFRGLGARSQDFGRSQKSLFERPEVRNVFLFFGSSKRFLGVKVYQPQQIQSGPIWPPFSDSGRLWGSEKSLVETPDFGLSELDSGASRSLVSGSRF